MLGKSPDPLKEFSRRIEQAFNKQARSIGDLQSQQEHLSRRVAHLHSNSESNHTMEELKRREEQYIQIVMLAGYAGFFALWTQTRGNMSLWMFASTGVLISISLIVFVGYELYKSWSLGRFFSSKPQVAAHELNAELSRINKHWHKVFVVSSSTGVIAGVSLLLWFVNTSILAVKGFTGAT